MRLIINLPHNNNIFVNSRSSTLVHAKWLKAGTLVLKSQGCNDWNHSPMERAKLCLVWFVVASISELCLKIIST